MECASRTAVLVLPKDASQLPLSDSFSPQGLQNMYDYCGSDAHARSSCLHSCCSSCVRMRIHRMFVRRGKRATHDHALHLRSIIKGVRATRVGPTPMRLPVGLAPLAHPVTWKRNSCTKGIGGFPPTEGQSDGPKGCFLPPGEAGCGRGFSGARCSGVGARPPP